MPNFKYEAKNFGGKTVSGKIQGADREAVVAELRKKNLIVLSVRAAGGGGKGEGSILGGVWDLVNGD